MLKRYGLVALREDIRDHFDVSGGGGRVPPRYNIAPPEPILVVVVPPRQTRRRLLPCRWGLIPAAASDDTAWARLVSLRLSLAARRPELSRLLRCQRCLVPATGFFQWLGVHGRVRPWHVRRGDGGLFAFAALWDAWQPPEGPEVHSCVILLGPPNPLLAQFGPQAPIVVPPGQYAAWLDPADDAITGAAWLGEPWDGADFAAYPVSTWVNDPRHDDPRCVAVLR